MRIPIHYDAERNVLYSKATEVITLEDIMGYYSKIERMNLNPGYSILADYTEAVCDISYEEITAMVERRRKFYRAQRPAKIAIIVRSDIMFGMARVYGGLIEPENIEVNVFRHRGDALMWLEIPETN